MIFRYVNVSNGRRLTLGLELMALNWSTALLPIKHVKFNFNLPLSGIFDN